MKSSPDDALIEELKAKVTQTLGLQISPGEIDPDAPMIDAIGIDSIDTLELAVMIEKDYGAKIDSRAAGVQAFSSLRSLAEFIRDKGAAKTP